MPLHVAVVVRLADRALLAQCALTTAGAAGERGAAAGEVPEGAILDLVSRCGAANVKSTYFTTLPQGGGDAARVSVFTVSNDAIAVGVFGDAALPRRAGFAACEELLRLFAKMFVEKASTLTPSMCDAFVVPAGDVLRRASQPGYPGDEKVARVRQVVEEAKGLALDNVEKALQRGEHIDDIVARSEELSSAAQGFHQQSRNLRMQMWWNSKKGQLLILGGVSVFLLCVYLIFCGGISCSSPGGK